MASNKLSALSAVSGSLTSDSLVYIADTQDSGSSYSSKKITVANLLSDVATTTDLGTFTGSTIDNNQSIKAALQALETAIETEASSRATAISDLVDGAPALLDTLNELAAAINDDENFVTTITNLIDANEVHIDNVVSLTGVSKDAANLGTFTGSTIADSSTIKAAIQALETAVETKATSAVVSEVDANVDDLISLTGIAENVTGLGTFTGSTISDGSTIKDALQDLETAAEAAAAGSAGGGSESGVGTGAGGAGAGAAGAGRHLPALCRRSGHGALWGAPCRRARSAFRRGALGRREGPWAPAHRGGVSASGAGHAAFRHRHWLQLSEPHQGPS